MRLIWISFALLLYANLAHSSDELEFLVGADATGLAAAPVDKLDGFRCADADANLADASEGLRKSPACKEGKDGFEKHVGSLVYDNYLYAVVKKSDVSKADKPYLCCVLWINACFDEKGNAPQLVTETENGKTLNIVRDCSDSKPCEDPENNFCLQEAAKDPKHPMHIGDATLIGKWKDLPYCCPNFGKGEVIVPVVTEPPTTKPPTTKPPTTKPPTTKPPTTKPPKTKPPKTKPPKTKPPKTKPPKTKPPTTKPPVTEPPVTEPPVTEPPVTEPPVTEPPVTKPPKNTPPENKPTVTQPPENPPPTDQPPENPSPDNPSSALSSLPLFPLLIFFLLME